MTRVLASSSGACNSAIDGLATSGAFRMLADISKIPLGPSPDCANDRIEARRPEIRRLEEPADREFQHLLVGLDRASRCARFGYAASDDSLVAHATTALKTASNVIGIYIENRLRGVLEAYRGGRGDHAEVALVVE